MLKSPESMPAEEKNEINEDIKTENLENHPQPRKIEKQGKKSLKIKKTLDSFGSAT